MNNYSINTRIKTFHGGGADTEMNSFIDKKSTLGNTKFGIKDIVISLDGKVINLIYWEIE